jgi:DNA-binding NarL/FixJ family response regulator
MIAPSMPLRTMPALRPLQGEPSRVLGQSPERCRSRIYRLSQRERGVVAALLAGSDSRAVTERLFISAHTVQDHLKSVFEKMGIHSRREMLAMFNAPQDGR